MLPSLELLMKQSYTSSVHGERFISLHPRNATADKSVKPNLPS